ncbi:MAG TPA: adenylate/guanylate cyclase domain-containing protein [Fimbriimonadaceae bacterium]|nr:adenylate/guanylate cyclase domain-containing protein [Fimbriimonadaceae bacterium]
MTALQKEGWLEFWRGLAISIAFSTPFSFLMPERNLPIVLVILIYALPFATGFRLFSVYVEPRLKRRSFLLTALLQLIGTALVLGISFLIAFVTFLCLNYRAAPWDQSVLQILGVIARSPVMHVSFLISMLLVFIVASVMAISKKLGPGVLRAWMLGYYHQPRQERRIFMFLDLRDSTTHAEALGDLQFSALIRDFFDDLTEPVLETKAEVSHYIGDEAVLTWKPELGLNQANCLRLFFLFQESLQKRASIYLERYGFVPGFKAGAHVGSVVTTEVGRIKSEIVYHGDTLNTAARIQSLCNGLGCDFLVSGSLLEQLRLPPGLEAEAMGSHHLKGKLEPVELWAVHAVGSTLPAVALR